MAKQLVVFAIILGVLYGLQLVLTNRQGAEADIESQLGKMKPQAWHFVALEYCYGMLNRTHIVFVTDAMICGARVRGSLPAPMAVTERWHDPHFYPRPDMVARYTQVDLTSPAFRRVSSANFQIPLSEVADVRFNAEPKWGMGPVPYSGRIHLRLSNGAKKELILLGRQDGPALVERLRACVSEAQAIRRVA